jgi:hypothetical protein
MTRAVVILAAVVAMLFGVAVPVGAEPQELVTAPNVCVDAGETVEMCVGEVVVGDHPRGCRVLWFRRVCVCRPVIGCEPHMTVPRLLRILTP